MKNLGEDKSIKDLDDIKYTCVMYMGTTSDWAHTPPDAREGGIFESAFTDSGSRGSQKFTERGLLSNPKSWVRHYDGSTFLIWKQIV